MVTKQKVNGRNYGAREGAKEPDFKVNGLSETVTIARDALMKLLEDNQNYTDEIKYLKAKLAQEQKINQTLKKLIVSTKVIG